MINVIIVENHAVIRASFSALLTSNSGITVTSAVSSAVELLSLLEGGAQADVVLSDIMMPGMDGIEMVTALRAKGNGIPVVLLSVLEEEKYASRAFLAGANAYLSKNVELDELIFCLTQVKKGKRYFASELCILLLERYHNHLIKISVENDNKLNFVERELSVLKLVSEGLTNQEIADRLFLSRRTVEGIRQTLLERTGSKNSVMLIRFAVMNGYV
ncbi:MAG: response regulator transcription factor [Sphingobacteriales bacterium]|nr:MAG: response regulator transcription factor [Sphingobacteriales bacterium]